MTKLPDQDVDIYFGEVNNPLPDWRQVLLEHDPDDELLDDTPEDVITMLGFDPKEEWGDDKGGKPPSEVAES